MKNEIFEMLLPDDFHSHFRLGEMLEKVLKYTSDNVGRAIVMPNTSPMPIFTAEDVERYRNEILEALREDIASGFTPLMTIQITESTTPEIIFAAKEAGAVAGKVYPRGMTSHSEFGVMDYKKIYPALYAMQECGMHALFHGESPKPDLFCLDREKAFLWTFKVIAGTFLNLKIILEHVTTAEAIDCIESSGENVAATITAHHLYLTLNDVVGGKLQPHNFCKPLAKREEDKRALIEAAISGNPKYFFGSDTAPWMREDKECSDGCAGCFTAPIALPLLISLFESENSLEKLENFCSGFGADFYGIQRNTKIVRYEKKPWVVPNEYHGIVPFMAGKTLDWQKIY